MPRASADVTSAALPSRIAILGAGSMGWAILSGLLAAENGTSVGLTVTTRSAASAQRLRRQLPADAGVQVLSAESDSRANALAVTGAEVVLLAVKPAGVIDLAAEVASALEPGAVVVSVAAGVPLSSIEGALPEGSAVLRAMPNTPASIGAGVTGLAAGRSASAEHRARARAVFETVGSVHEVPEERIDAVTAISGSGPAYLFLFVEALAEAGRARGLDDTMAEALAAETVRGAAELLAGSGLPPAELRGRVTSPGGTTAKAIEVFEQRGLRGIVDAATAAAAARAAEMSASYR